MNNKTFKSTNRSRTSPLVNHKQLRKPVLARAGPDCKLWGTNIDPIALQSVPANKGTKDHVLKVRATTPSQLKKMIIISHQQERE